MYVCMDSVCRCVAMVSIPMDLYSESFCTKVLHTADVGIRARSVRDDSQLVRLSMDPHSCCGLLEVCKFSVPGCVSLPVCEPMLLMVRLLPHGVEFSVGGV